VAGNKRPSFLKRQKEQKRQARATEKREARRDRKAVKATEGELPEFPELPVEEAQGDEWRAVTAAVSIEGIGALVPDLAIWMKA
jgi:hypothetical protein